MVADVKLLGVYVPRLGAGEGIQHEPHYTQALAGKHDVMYYPAYIA